MAKKRSKKAKKSGAAKLDAAAQEQLTNIVVRKLQAIRRRELRRDEILRAIRIDGKPVVFATRPGVSPDFLFKKKKKQKTPAPRGRPQEYDVPAISKLAEDILTHGVPDKLAWLEEKVRYLAAKQHIKLPAESRMNQILSPIYHGAKNKKR